MESSASEPDLSSSLFISFNELKLLPPKKPKAAKIAPTVENQMQMPRQISKRETLNSDLEFCQHPLLPQI